MKDRQTLSEDLKRRAAKAPKQAQVPIAPVPVSYRLPAWPEDSRGVPNAVLRSALFGVIKRGRRAFMQRQPIAAVDGVGILFTGPRLDQADLDVWEECLHIARTQDLGTRAQFGARDFLRSIGRHEGGTQIEWLKGAFARLASSVVEIQDGKRAYFGPMIHHGTRDDETGLYCIEINPAIVTLYGEDGWTQTEWTQRQALSGQPLAQWVHSFYATHARPFGYKVSTIYRLCGSENAQLRGFRRELKEALARVAEMTGWGLEIDENDLVQVRKKPTPSQGRHLLRNGK
jgi:hypothetical protein